MPRCKTPPLFFLSAVSLSAGGALQLRLDRGVYNAYDYTGFNLHTVARAPFGGSSLTAGYTLSTRGYWNLDDSNYSDQNVFAQFTHVLPSKTTLRGDASYSTKSHYNKEGQVLVGAQLAQSLGPATGVSFRYQARINTIAREPDIIVGGIAFSIDDDLLLDRYDYGGRELTARLTQLMPRGVKAVLEIGRETQRYEGRVALDAVGAVVGSGEDRMDRIGFGSVLVELPLTQRVSLDVLYRFERAHSNDAYYDYGKRNAVSTSLGVDF